MQRLNRGRSSGALVRGRRSLHGCMTGLCLGGGEVVMGKAEEAYVRCCSHDLHLLMDDGD